MEVKWLMIGWAVIMGTMFAGMGIEGYQKSQCKLAGIQANMPVADIERVCK